MPVYKRNHWLLITVFFLCSCWQAKPGSHGVLSVNSMKLVMWDMLQADQFAAIYLKKDTTINLQKETNTLYQKVFALHKIDSARFFNSIAYYKNHPKDYKLLMDSLSLFSIRERDSRFYLNLIDTAAKPKLRRPIR